MWIPQFHTNSILGKFELACNKCACVRRSCLKSDMVEKLVFCQTKYYIWYKSLVADRDCVAILCSVLCSDLVEHIESISRILC